MKCTEMRYVVGAVLAVVVFCAGCSGGSSDSIPAAAADPTEVEAPASATPTVVPTDVPAETPEPTAVSATDAERLDAVLAELDENGVDEGVGLIAWDVLDWNVNGELVDVSLCGWTGQDAFDSVYSSLWVVSGEAGQLVAREQGTSFDAGECLNTELIDSAFEFIAEYEEYWTEMVRYPDRFEGDPRSERLLTDIRLADAEAYTRRLVENGEYGDGLGLDGRPRETGVMDSLYRRYDDEGERVLELAFCRPMGDGYGTYSSAGVLLDDDMVSDPGPHTVDAYVLQRSVSAESWLYLAKEGLVWADCLGGGDPVAAANQWRPGPVSFVVVPR